MRMPDAVLLSYYLPRNAFLDKKSKEDSTGIVKSKYKLLFKRHKEWGVYVFFVLTTEKSACAKERTCSIYPKDWEHREETHLGADCSYVDVQKAQVLSKTEVIEKASNPSIGFSYAGRILQTKFSELSSVLENYLSSITIKTDCTIRDILQKIMAEDASGAFVSKYDI